MGINGGLNHYVFCMNDPVFRRDPFGGKSKHEKQVERFSKDALEILQSEWLSEEGKRTKLDNLVKEYSDVYEAMDILNFLWKYKEGIDDFEEWGNFSIDFLEKGVLWKMPMRALEDYRNQKSQP
jgi:hypothetical protein